MPTVESTELVSVDETIEAIAREALAEAKRIEESEKYRKSAGPPLPLDPNRNT